MSLSILRQSLFPLARLEARAFSTAPALFKAAADAAPKEKKAPKAKDESATKEKKATKPKATKAKKVKAEAAEDSEPKIRGRPRKGAELDPVDIPPKRSSTAYGLFFKDFYKSKTDKPTLPNGSFDVKSLATEIGAAWAALPEEQRTSYQETAKANLAKWEKEYRDWYFARTLVERNAIEKALGKRLWFPGGRAKFNQELRERPGNPGRPSSSFFEYLRSIKPEISSSPEAAGLAGIELHTHVAKAAAERWRELSEEEKASWKAVYLERKAKFDEWFKTQEESGPQKSE